MHCTTGNSNDLDEEFILKKKKPMTINSSDKRQRKYCPKEGKIYSVSLRIKRKYDIRNTPLNICKVI